MFWHQCSTLSVKPFFQVLNQDNLSGEKGIQKMKGNILILENPLKKPKEGNQIKKNQMNMKDY